MSTCVHIFLYSSTLYIYIYIYIYFLKKGGKGAGRHPRRDLSRPAYLGCIQVLNFTHTHKHWLFYMCVGFLCWFRYITTHTYCIIESSCLFCTRFSMGLSDAHTHARPSVVDAFGAAAFLCHRYSTHDKVASVITRGVARGISSRVLVSARLRARVPAPVRLRVRVLWCPCVHPRLCVTTCERGSVHCCCLHPICPSSVAHHYPLGSLDPPVSLTAMQYAIECNTVHMIHLDMP